MKHVQLFEQFISEAELSDLGGNWTNSRSAENIDAYIDWKAPNQPMYYIKRLTAPEFEAEDGMDPNKIMAAIKKSWEGTYEISTATEDQVIYVKTDRRGRIRKWDRAGSPKTGKDGKDRFEWITE